MTDGQTDGQTDRQTDRILIAIPRLHYMQRGNKTAKIDFINSGPSVKLVHCDKTVERPVQISYHTKDHLA